MPHRVPHWLGTMHALQVHTCTAHLPLQSLVQSLTKSYDIVNAQKKQAKTQLSQLQAKLDKQQQQQQPLNEIHPSQDLEDLQLKLVDLNNKVLRGH